MPRSLKLLSWKSSAWKLFTLALMPWTLLFPVAAMADDSLPAGVRNVLNHRKLADANLSLYVENLRTGETVLSWNEDKPRNPASVSKLLTTLVALEKLGPSYTWKTDIFYAGELKDDVLEGDLLLKGYGDPFLTTERLWTMLHAVRDTGVSRINGNLLLDDSYFDIGEYDPAAFDNSPLRAYNVAPNALLMNFKVVRYQFTPDAGGGKVNVRLHPELENLQVVNQLSIGDGRCGGYQRGITITPNESVDQMIFSGTFPRGCSSYAMTRTALGHNDFASLGQVQQYMGVNVTLTGLRGLLAPPLSAIAYTLLERRAPGAGRLALLLPLLRGETRLFMSMGAQEVPEGMIEPFQRYVAALEQSNHPNLLFGWRLFDGENHGSVVPVAFNSGFRFIYTADDP